MKILNGFSEIFRIFAPKLYTKSNIYYGIQFQRDRKEVATPMGGERNLPGGRGREEKEVLCAQHVSLSFWSRIARGTSAGLHRQRHLCPLQATEGLQRAQPDGLRCLRTACRTICHTDGSASRHHYRTEHQPLPRTARQDRLLVRLGPRGAHVRPKLLQVDAVGLPAHVPLLFQHVQPEGSAHHQAHRALRADGYPKLRCAGNRGAALHCQRLGQVL